MMKQDTARYWIEKLGLEPHAEGGWYRELWRSDIVIPGSVLPPDYGGDRSACTMIHYLLEGEERSAWHRVRSAEIWLWHAGGTLELSLGGGGDAPAEKNAFLLGPALPEPAAPLKPTTLSEPAAPPESGKGECFQAVVPPGIWQSAKIREGSFVLVSCIVSPGFHWEDFSLPEGNR
jgi:predicted cupin superfamily sugar epimerase